MNPSMSPLINLSRALFSALFLAWTIVSSSFRSLQGQGLSDREMNRAAQLTLRNFGINDSSSAGVLSGTSNEANAIKAQGRETARVLGDIAGAAAQMDVSEISINEATIIASKLIFQEEISRVSQQNRANGGMIYASKGMFVPRGTDTVPAMLTPGEFVINRSAVKRGNNLQMLKAMNSSSGAGSPSHMNRGGRVYYNGGGQVEGGGNAFMEALPALKNVFADFSLAVDKLANMQFHVKLDTTNVNVNFNGLSFLATMKEDIKSELLEKVREEIGNAKTNLSGKIVTDRTGVLNG